MCGFPGRAFQAVSLPTGRIRFLARKFMLLYGRNLQHKKGLLVYTLLSLVRFAICNPQQKLINVAGAVSFSDHITPHLLLT